VVVVVGAAVVVVVVGAAVVVVVVVLFATHVHCGVQCSPAGQRSAPDGELGSHCSPGSTLPLPQVDSVVVVVVDAPVVVVVVDETPVVVVVGADVVVVVVGASVVVVGASVVVVVAGAVVVVVLPATQLASQQLPSLGTPPRAVQRSALDWIEQRSTTGGHCELSLHVVEPSSQTPFAQVPGLQKAHATKPDFLPQDERAAQRCTVPLQLASRSPLRTASRR
jgi:hypothetical protein